MGNEKSLLMPGKSSSSKSTKSMTPSKSNKEDKLSQEERRVRTKKGLEPTRYSCVRGGK